MILTKPVGLFSINWNTLGYIMLSRAIYFNSRARAKGTNAVCKAFAVSLSKLSKGLYLFLQLLLMYLSPVEMSTVPQHTSGLTRMSKEEQASHPSYCCLSLVPFGELKLPPRASKNLLFLSIGQETKVSDIRIATSMCKVSVKINPFLVGLILSKSEQN